MDLTEYGVNELSLVVFNTEGLYSIRHKLTQYNLDAYGIICTEEQWDQFQTDLEEEV